MHGAQAGRRGVPLHLCKGTRKKGRYKRTQNKRKVGRKGRWGGINSGRGMCCSRKKNLYVVDREATSNLSSPGICPVVQHREGKGYVKVYGWGRNSSDPPMGGETTPQA